MGYVTSTLPSSTSRTLKVALCDDFSGGVCFGNGMSGDGKIPFMYNMTDDGGTLRTRDGKTPLYNGMRFDGEFYGSYNKDFSGHVVVHIGSKLVAVSANEKEPLVLYDGMPNKKSIMVYFCGKLYVYCDACVFSVDESLNFKLEIPKPLHFDFSGDNGHIYTDKEYEYNMIAPVISVSYGTSNMNYRYNLPSAKDPDKPFWVFEGDRQLVENVDYTLSEGGGAVYLTKGIDVDLVKVIYYLKDPSIIGYENIFERMTVAESYGGESMSGTRIYMSGDAQNAGRIYMSELMDPLSFPKSSFETVGGDIDNITGMIRQYGRLVLFTGRNVMRMTYSLEDGLPGYTFKEISSQMGCDMPGSIQLVDNRVVFASSTKGVFILDATEDFGEQNVKPVSENINGKSDLAFLMCENEDKLNASSADIDRKYFLSVGDKVYVWDYGNCAYYSDSGNYAKAQKRLSWYVYTDMNAKTLLECERKLVCVSNDGGIVISVLENTGMDAGIPVHSCFRSEKLDFSSPAMMKTPEKLALDVRTLSAGSVRITVGDTDGVYYSTELFARGYNDERDRVVLSLPKKSVGRLYFEIESEVPIVLYSAAIYYRMSKNQKM